MNARLDDSLFFLENGKKKKENENNNNNSLYISMCFTPPLLLQGQHTVPTPRIPNESINSPSSLSSKVSGERGKSDTCQCKCCSCIYVFSRQGAWAYRIP